MRLEIAEGEAVDSWVEALGRRYRAAPARMLTLLGLNRQSNYVNTLLQRAGPQQWEQAEHAARLPPGSLRAAAGAEYTAVSVLRSGASRFCPRCLEHSGGRWLLTWRLNWSVACLRHRVLLAERCPVCGNPQRSRITGGSGPVAPATCAHNDEGRQRCGADLTLTHTSPAGLEHLEAQAWIEQLLEGLRGPQQAEAACVFTDLPIITSWLARRGSTTEAPRERRGYGTVPAADAAQCADLLATARTLLTGSDLAAIDACRQIVAQVPTGYRIPPPGMGHHRWRALTPLFPNRYLRAVDTHLHAGDRLRTKSATPTAARVGEGGHERARKLPQLLWPDWTARLLPRAGFLPDQFRAVISACVLLPGSPGRSHAQIAAALNPHLARASITMALQGLADIDGEASLRPILILLCRIADYLDQHGSMIDYGRRRAVAASWSMPWHYWHELACAAGAHPGIPSRPGRHLHAKRYIHNVLTGSDLTDPAHPLALGDAGERSRYVTFAATLTPALRRALYREAEDILDAHRIDEPLTWSPPAELADGLDLPGTVLTGTELDVIRRIVIDRQGTPRLAAEALGLNIEHVRIALENLDRPERAWKGAAAPATWQRDQANLSILTREFFEHEYNTNRRTLREIGESLDLSRAVIARYARRHGIETNQVPRKTIALDEAWLREQYLDRQRSTIDIANEAGVTQMTIARNLERIGVQLRPAGVGSRRQMLTTLDRRLSPDVRAAVDASLHGWTRLRRFQIAMALPSLDEADRHLGMRKSGLVTQLQRLERDIGEVLYNRCALGRPHTPTPRGRKLLQALDRPATRKLMIEALGPALEPIPGQAAIDAAYARFHTPPKKRGPLTPFDDIAVERIRIKATTLRLLQDLVDHDDEQFYGEQIVKRASIDAGTLYPQLHRLHDAGWLTSWPEDEQQWLAGAPPGRGPGRRRTYYTLTPDGRRAAQHEIDTRTTNPKKTQRR